MSAGPDDQDPPQSPPPQRRATDHGERRKAEQRTTQDAGTPRYLDPGDTVFSLWGRVIMARYRRIAAAATRHIIQRPLHIGVSARIFHPEPGATGLRSKNLQYLEESIAQWVMSRDVLVFMIPTVNTDGLLHPSNIRLRDYAKHLDGLVLQGGADVSPQSYSESPTRPEWGGDRARDMYELELLHEFVEAGKPVLGICRGCQLINVAFGGTLYQDIATQVPDTIGHHDAEIYDRNFHHIRWTPGSQLAGLYPDTETAQVNTIHHQAVKTLGKNLIVEARSEPDQVVEALRWQGDSYVFGVQWHPELHDYRDPNLMDGTPILREFLDAAQKRAK